MLSLVTVIIAILLPLTTAYRCLKTSEVLVPGDAHDAAFDLHGNVCAAYLFYPSVNISQPFDPFSVPSCTNGTVQRLTLDTNALLGPAELTITCNDTSDCYNVVVIPPSTARKRSVYRRMVNNIQVRCSYNNPTDGASILSSRPWSNGGSWSQSATAVATNLSPILGPNTVMNSNPPPEPSTAIATNPGPILGPNTASPSPEPSTTIATNPGPISGPNTAMNSNPTPEPITIIATSSSAIPDITPSAPGVSSPVFGSTSTYPLSPSNSCCPCTCT